MEAERKAFEHWLRANAPRIQKCDGDLWDLQQRTEVICNQLQDNIDASSLARSTLAMAVGELESTRSKVENARPAMQYLKIVKNILAHSEQLLTSTKLESKRAISSYNHSALRLKHAQAELMKMCEGNQHDGIVSHPLLCYCRVQARKGLEVWESRTLELIKVSVKCSANGVVLLSQITSGELWASHADLWIADSEFVAMAISAVKNAILEYVITPCLSGIVQSVKLDQAKECVALTVLLSAKNGNKMDQAAKRKLFGQAIALSLKAANAHMAKDENSHSITQKLMMSILRDSLSVALKAWLPSSREVMDSQKFAKIVMDLDGQLRECLGPISASHSFIDIDTLLKTALVDWCQTFAQSYVDDIRKTVTLPLSSVDSFCSATFVASGSIPAPHLLHVINSDSTMFCMPDNLLPKKSLPFLEGVHFLASTCIATLDWQPSLSNTFGEASEVLALCMLKVFSLPCPYKEDASRDDSMLHDLASHNSLHFLANQGMLLTYSAMQLHKTVPPPIRLLSSVCLEAKNSANILLRNCIEGPAACIPKSGPDPDVILSEQSAQYIVDSASTKFSSFCTAAKKCFSPGQYLQFILQCQASALEAAVKYVFKYTSIAAEECPSLELLLAGFNQLSPPGPELDVEEFLISGIRQRYDKRLIHVLKGLDDFKEKLFARCSMLEDMMQMSLSDIAGMAKDGSFEELFSAVEVVQLITALFLDTPKRDEALRTVKTSMC